MKARDLTKKEKSELQKMMPKLPKEEKMIKKIKISEPELITDEEEIRYLKIIPTEEVE